ncbi:MAG: thioesterase family protein [Planctomycetota bacterium]
MPPADDLPTNVLDIRVRYTEVDAMGYLHHSRYLQYFEMGRTELLRQYGVAYADLERSGTFVVVIEAAVRYRRPAKYDDVVTLRTIESKRTPTRIFHDYELKRDGVQLATGNTCIVCTDPAGSPIRLPDVLEITAQTNR